MYRPVFTRLLFILIIIASIVFATVSCNNSSEKVLQDEINMVSAKWAPDHRVAICSAEVKASGKQIILKGETTIPDAKSDLIKTLVKFNSNLIDSFINTS